jgi:methylmalonyl-CoA/ethylmalonyl-CoA epimerase
MFTRVHHVAIAVRSLDEALRFYREALDLTVNRKVTLPDEGVRAALLSVGADEIELLEPVDPEGGVARFLTRKGEGLHHVCLETPDIVRAVAEARAADLPLIGPAPRDGLAGRIAFLHPRASAGVLIEMAQPNGPAGHSGVSEIEVSSRSFETIYIAVKDLAGTAATYIRNFGGRPAPGAVKKRFGARTAAVRIGASCLTLLNPDPAASAGPIDRFLTDRGEGLLGIGLRVSDLARSIRGLEDRGVPFEMEREAGATALAGIDPSRAHGVNLFLVASGPDDQCPISKSRWGRDTESGGVGGEARDLRCEDSRS